MNHSVLKNIVSIVIDDCRNCLCLPPFGDLPCLESLELCWGSADVEYVEEVDIDVHSTRIRFPSLRKLVICAFRNLKGLVKKEGGEQFPVLEEMEIRWCPVFVIPTLSSVKKLVAYGTSQMQQVSGPYLIFGLLLPSVFAKTKKLLRSQKRCSKALQISNTWKLLCVMHSRVSLRKG
uniref:Putative ovule protein n=1 Tax=Solanum chacoense TaxID=4108 RepID=A0A0V0GX98_SOLCH